MNPEPLPPPTPSSTLNLLRQQSGDASARAYAETEQKTPVAAAKSYKRFREKTYSIFVPVVRKIYGGM